MLLRLSDYLQYIAEYKHPSPRTIEDYKQTLASVGIDEVDTEAMPELYAKLLNEKLPKCGYSHINRFLAITSAWSKKQGIKYLVKDLNYSKLYDKCKIKSTENIRQAYTDEQLMLLFAGVQRDNTPLNGLYNLCLLLLYSGIRISAANNIRWENVTKVEGYPVYTFRVASKGVEYNAFCADRVINFIRKNCGNSPTLIYYDSNSSSPFDKAYRKKLEYVVRSKSLYEIRKNTSIFHSFRKAFSQKLLTNPELDPEGFTFKALMGHIPRKTTGTKFYIMPDGTKAPLDIIKRCADAYSKSILMTTRIGI